MKKIILLVLFTLSLFANLSFPRLSGVIVDEANLLDNNTTIKLKKIMLENEAKTTSQFVIATVKSLNNASIEEYSLELARHWQLGQKDKDNGVLLLVAPKEREVRIEVGYGLEGVLTDAMAKYVINNFITNKFKQNDYQGGIKDGAIEILKLLKGDKLDFEKYEENKSLEEDKIVIFIGVIFFGFNWFILDLLLGILLITKIFKTCFLISLYSLIPQFILYKLYGHFAHKVVIEIDIILFMIFSIYIVIKSIKEIIIDRDYSSIKINLLNNSKGSNSGSSSFGSSYRGGGGRFGGGGASGRW